MIDINTIVCFPWDEHCVIAYRCVRSVRPWKEPFCSVNGALLARSL